ncbi:hypothetical protein [Streptomyces sp. SD31]|uniref:hypothetical protein n=1 Tax=Streptomyces sp. SD31 TaxID=3452208 RepID=UPI003F89A53F
MATQATGSGHQVLWVPAHHGFTGLYVEANANLVRGVFQGSRVRVEAARDEVGAASALKTSFASFQKAARTLAAVSHALAESHGVADLLTAEGQRALTSLPDPGGLGLPPSPPRRLPTGAGPRVVPSALQCQQTRTVGQEAVVAA